MEALNVSFFANPDDPQATLLHWAVLQGDLGEVQALLAAEPGSVAAADGNGWTALHWAAGAGQAECAAVLVKAGASLEARGSETHTPWVAKLAKLLVFDSPQCHAEVDALTAAGFVEAAQRMRDALARPDAKATAGATPLHVAAGMGAADCVSGLLKLGAQLEAANSNGLAALHLAAACNHVPALQALVQAGADVHAGDGDNNTPLHVAAGLDSLECLQDLMRLGAIADARGYQGSTPLHMAAGLGATACVRELLAAGADMEAGAAYDARPLHFAAAEGKLEALCVLIEAGAYVHAIDEHGQTALHCAAAAGSVEVASALVAAGADLEAATTEPLESKTPIQVAAVMGDMAMASALAAAGANINRESEHGISCLHLFLVRACKVCIPEAPKRLQQLLDAGASVQLACATWPTPVDAMLLCIENPRECKVPSYVPELIRTLVAAGCSISTSRSSQQGDLMINSIISWCNRLAADTDWPPSLSSSAVDLGCVLLGCLEAEIHPEEGDTGFLMWSTLRTGSIQLAVRAAGLLLKAEGEPVALYHVKQLFEHYMKGLPRPGWGAWGETHRRLVQHFCDLSEALLAAGCPPIELRVSSKDRAAVACAEPAHIPGARLFEMDLPDWAEPHLREVVPLAGSGLRWSPSTHRAFPPRFRAAAGVLLLANHRGLAAPLGSACHGKFSDSGLPKSSERIQEGDTRACTPTRVHLPPEVVLLILNKAAHPPTAWVPQLQPGASEASTSATSRLLAVVEWASTDLLGRLKPCKVGLGVVAVAVGAAVVFRLKR